MVGIITQVCADVALCGRAQPLRVNKCLSSFPLSSGEGRAVGQMRQEKHFRVPHPANCQLSREE